MARKLAHAGSGDAVRDLRMATFRGVIDRYATVQPDAPFLIAPESSSQLTYGDLQDRCRRFVALLGAHQVRPGSTVSFMLENGVSAATVFLGAMYGGFVVSPVNLLAQDAQLEYTLVHSDTRLVFASEKNGPRLQRIKRATGAAFEIRIVDIDGI